MTNAIPQNWNESYGSKPARATRRARVAKAKPTMSYESICEMVAMMAQKFDAESVAEDPDFEYAANMYLTLYMEGLSAGTRRQFDYLDSMAEARARYKILTPGQIKGILNCLRADLQRAAAPAPAVKAPLTDGMYRLADGTIYKVQVAVHGSGNLYAKRLVLDASVTPAHVSFEYEQGAMRKLTIADKMTLEQAKEFGALYGTCCMCGRTLTDERSIANGIGPICEGRF